ncbi:response regulator [Gilvimarinus sp. DA14]|uniref:response regulator n=1 Tax=Gilvimarinus sp. DA14 TaxID=2956798 RepID=UPI0020B7EE63|nr:response regulator [Gilvimarinus sp. DA14]UTF58723.1 response regulator [Gilvimarinus sp. DA14]
MDRDTILLVEDNPDEAELAQLAFARLDSCYDLQIVTNGEEALDFSFASGRYEHRPAERKPGLILLDIDLPQISGFDVLRTLRASSSYSHTPIAMLTTSDERDDIAHGYALGASSYLQKPLDFEGFAQLLQAVSHYWLRLNTRIH